MLEKLNDLPAGVIGLRATGMVSKEDYETCFEPILDKAKKGGKQLRFLYHLGPEFSGFTPGAMWQDAKLGLQAMGLFEGIALISDLQWIREAAHLLGFLMPCPVKVFDCQDVGEAVEWLQSLPKPSTLSHHLLPDSGVIVVEVKEALRAEDFESLASTADTWLQTHGELSGLVIHAREFPGWKNVGSLLQHARFVRDHHRTVKRVALAADSKVANLALSLAKHFVQAEVKKFEYGELEEAIAWTEESTAPPPPRESIAPRAAP